MVQIFLTDDQVRSIAKADGAFSLVDSAGNLVGIAQPTTLSAKEVEKVLARAASNGPWRTTAEVMERLRQMEQPAS